MKFFTRFDYDGSPGAFAAFREIMLQRKVVHFRGFAADASMEDQFAHLAQATGDFLNKDESDTGEVVHGNWLDIRYDPEKADSYRHSNTRQPLHTDGSYTDLDFDIIFFFCREAAESGGATTFIDGERVIELLQAQDLALYTALRKTPVSFEKGAHNYKVANVISEENGMPAFNWNHYRVSDTNPESVREMCTRFHTFCEEVLVGGGALYPVRLAPGEAVFFHDRLTLHGRTAFQGSRCLLKGAVKLVSQAQKI